MSNLTQEEINQRVTNRDVSKDIDKLYDHAKIANEEMGKIKESLSAVKTDIDWIRESLDKVDARIWWILTAVILGVGIQIVIRLVWK